jgi:hypothetical protein
MERWRPHGRIETSWNDGNPMQRWQPHATTREEEPRARLQDTSEPAGGGVRWRSPPAFEACRHVVAEGRQGVASRCTLLFEHPDDFGVALRTWSAHDKIIREACAITEILDLDPALGRPRARLATYS